jgi:hypothetical protein
MTAMRYLTSAIALAALLGVTAGCTGYPISDDTGRAGNYQTAAGLNVVEFDELECQPDLGLCGPTKFRMIGGKEQENVSVTMYTAAGDKVFEYTAEGVEAFQGQKFRAEVEKVLAEQYGDVAGTAVEGIVSAARAAVGAP